MLGSMSIPKAIPMSTPTHLPLHWMPALGLGQVCMGWGSRPRWTCTSHCNLHGLFFVSLALQLLLPALLSTHPCGTLGCACSIIICACTGLAAHAPPLPCMYDDAMCLHWLGCMMGLHLVSCHWPLLLALSEHMF